MENESGKKNEIIRKIWKSLKPGNLKQTQIKMKTQWNVKQDHQDHNMNEYVINRLEQKSLDIINYEILSKTL